MGVGELLLLLLCGLSVAIQEGQGSSALSVSPPVTAACGEPVTLHCSVSHSQGLEVKSLSWVHVNAILCEVTGDDQPPTSATEGVQCAYVDNTLSVTFLQKSPRQHHGSENYICKLRSNQGLTHNTTSVKPKGCSQRVEEEAVPGGPPSCTFTGVFPRAGGSYPVDWFHGGHRLTEGNAGIKTEDSVDADCCVTVRSTLESRHTGPLNCSLWDEGLKMYTLTRVQVAAQDPTLTRVQVAAQDPHTKRVVGTAARLGSQWGIWTFVIVSVLWMSSS